MNYFLRNFVDTYSPNSYSATNRKEYDTNHFVDDTTFSSFLNLPFKFSPFAEILESEEGDGANAVQLDFQAYSCYKQECRDTYSKLLLLCAKQLHKSGILYSANADLDAIAMQQECIQNNMGDKVPSETQEHWRKFITVEELDIDMLLEANRYISVIALPSSFGANTLAQTTVLRYSALLNLQNGDKKLVDDNMEGPSNLVQVANNFNSPEPELPHQRRGFQLMTIGLDSIFSVMLELNLRDSELCAQALQSLLQLLQNLPVDTLRSEPQSVVVRMHNLLKRLRVEGNASVSTCANACMVSLSVAYGHPEFVFSTISALLCDAKKNIPFNQLSSDCNILPKNFQNLALAIQQNVQKEVCLPENEHLSYWSSLLKNADFLCDFELFFASSQSSRTDFHGADDTPTMPNGSIVSNGSYVFVLTIHGLLKAGTGLTETKNGEILSCNELLKYSEGSVLLVCNESLYLRRKHSSRLWVLDVETLRELGEIMLPCLLSEGVLFSDGRSFYHALLDDQWNFTTTLLDDASFTPVEVQKARQSSRLIEIGYAVIGDVNAFQSNILQSIPSSLQGTIVDIQLNAEIGFIMTRHGKVFYAGNGIAFDLQDTSETWTELALVEPMVGMTCHTNCLILRSGSGHLWAVGSLTDFFDNQLHSKALIKKARKIRIANKRRCTSIASTAGCMGYVTDNGRCFFHGRHVIASQDVSEGFDSIPAASVGLGKTHVVVVSKSGMLYTSGLNNMNQCGREEHPRIAVTCLPSHDAINNSERALPSSSIYSTGSGVSYCSRNMHLFVKDVASICMRCGKCSAKGDACPFLSKNYRSVSILPKTHKFLSTSSTSSPTKLPRGSPCLCGVGESSCLRCGICKCCSDLVAVNQLSIYEKLDEKEEHGNFNSKSMEENEYSVMEKLEKRDFSITSSSKKLQKEYFNRETDVKLKKEIKPEINSNIMHPLMVPYGLQTPDTSTMSVGRVILQSKDQSIKVSSVSVGNYHTVVLCADHQVFTFGSNCHGQLGTGDTLSRTGPHRLNIPSNLQVVQAVAGANHCVLRTMEGQVITFGAHKFGQLGRRPANSNDKYWFAKLTILPGYGYTCGKLAIWVGAQGDRTLIQCQKQIFSKTDLANCYITANQKFCLILPANKKVSSRSYVVLNRRGVSSFQHFKLDLHDINSMVNRSLCLDPRYLSLIWAYDLLRMRVFAYKCPNHMNLLGVYEREKKQQLEPSYLTKHRKFLHITELLLPSEPDIRFSDTQMAIYLLSCLYSMNVCAIAGTLERSTAGRDELYRRKSSTIAPLTNGSVDEYLVVNRFENYGGGWGFSAHCVEAIQFKTSCDITFCGVGLFGGRGEYVGKLKLFRVIGGAELEEQCVELLGETDEVIYECSPRETAFLQLAKTIPVKANQWHVIWAQIQGPSSDCGAGGQVSIRSENVEFQFRSSLLSNNGTDTDVGQIPEIYYRVEKSGNNNDGQKQSSNNQHLRINNEIVDNSPEERKEDSFSPTVQPRNLFNVSSDSLCSLYSILNWATQGTFSSINYSEMIQNAWKQERSAFVAIVALRMIRLYLGIAFRRSTQRAEDNEKGENNTSEQQKTIESTFEFHCLLTQLFQSADERLFSEDTVGLVLIDEAIEAYVACAFLFVPSTKVLHKRLARMLNADALNNRQCWSLLALLRVSAKFDENILPILTKNSEVESETDKLNNKNDQFIHKLVEKFDEMSEQQDISMTASQFIKFLYQMAFVNVEDLTNECALTIRLKLAAQKLIAKLAKSLVLSGVHPRTGPALLQTPNRFGKTCPHLNWDVGNNAYDAIAFKVDTAGINLHGVGVYLSCTSNQQYGYDLELLVNNRDSLNERWELAEKATGCVSDRMEPGSIEHQQAVNTECLPQIAIIRFSKPTSLRPDVCYAVRLLLNGGKTFYGEDGVCSLRLQKKIQLNFMPCSLSENGTTILRGQIPSLLYSINKAPCTENSNKVMFQHQDEGVIFAANLEEQNKVAACSSNPNHQLFVLILRLLAQKISAISVTGKLSTADRKMCSQVVGYANVFVELHPWMAFDVIAAVDEVLPLIATVNACQNEGMKEEEQQKLQKQRHTKKDEQECFSDKKSFSRSVAQAVVESPHPYKSGYIYSQKARFEKSVEFLYIRFHDECQTLHGDDCLRIFVATSAEGDGKESTFYPVGRYSGSKDWPETMLLVPGNCLWFILESSPTQEDCSDPSKMYGFRCTIDGISNSSSLKDLNAVLGQEFTWLCANACRLLVQLPSSNTKKLCLKEQSTREFLRKHGSLLKKGLNIAMPALKQVLADQLPKTTESQELKFIKEFIVGDVKTSAGALAKLVVAQPYVDLINSTISVEQEEEQFCAGKSIKLTLLPKDQYNEIVDGFLPVNYKLDVKVVITSGASDPQFCVESKSEQEKSSTKKSLKALQLTETYRSVYVNKARYMSLTMMPVFSNYSFEELRLAFQHNSSTKVTLKLEKQQHNDLSWTPYHTEWKPRRAGRYQLQCIVDGFYLQNSKIFNISDTLSPTRSSTSLQKSTPKTNKPAAMPKVTLSGTPSPTLKSCLNTHRAVCHGTSPFKGIRVRSHPTLSAHQIGIIPRGVVFDYTEIVKNGDGVWLKLAGESKAHYTDHPHHYRSQNGGVQAWCLQFNQHLQVEYLQVSQPLNGNNIEEKSEQPVQSCLKSTPKKSAQPKLSPSFRSKQVGCLALSPGVLDCCRSVFVAIVWHEKGLLSSLTTAANHLKSQPELEEIVRRVVGGPKRMHQQQLTHSSIPMPMQSMLFLWDKVAQAVLSVIDKQLIVPSSLDTRKAASKVHCLGGEEENRMCPVVNDNEQDELCELCERYFARPITSHMRTYHPGCGGPSFSHGYNSVGNYTTGWTGACGEGGHGNAVWYLMCPNCRMNHLKRKGSCLQPKAGSDQQEIKGGLVSNTSEYCAQKVLKRNALFLLNLKPEDEKSNDNCQPAGANRHQGEWTINMFPPFASPLPQIERPSAQMVMEEQMSSADEEEEINYNVYKSSPYRHFSHLSDPGVFGTTIESMNVDVLVNDVSSLSASANLYKRTSTPLKLLRNTYKPSSRNRFTFDIDEYIPSLTNELVDSGKDKHSSRIDGAGSSNLLGHPVMAFIIENHDLELVSQAFHTSIQRAVCFSYAFRVWNWLLKIVTSESSVSDIVWHHLTAMASYFPLNQWLTNSISMKFSTHLRLLPHPWRLCLLAGDQITERMVADFHAFLTTLAVVLQSPSVDIQLKCLCFRAWTFQLTIHEQNLLITLCNLLATVGAVLSESSESAIVSALDESAGARVNRKTSSTRSSKSSVEQMDNITEAMQMESSSRVQLLPCLTDGSYDTFWESGDEDRNRTKRLSISWDSLTCSASLLAVFIDNIKDEGFRVTQITIRSVQKSAVTTSPSRTSIKGLLHNAQVDLSYVGWIKCCVAGTNCVQIILKGDEAGCRLRQLVVFGNKNEIIDDDNVVNAYGRGQTMKPSASHQLLFNTAQMDAFSLFQAISAQAFSDEFAEEQNGTLRQQVLDLLFNRVQLQPLQSYVCFQMVSAVEREVVNLRERGKRNYSYACGIMGMLVKICESRKGLEVFSQRNGLLIVLSELLLFAPQVVQFQVIETIERLIRHFKPWVFDCSQFVQNILAVLAKAISLQIKDKIAHKVYSHTLTNHAADIPTYWRMDRQVTLEVAHMLIKHLSKISSGSMSDQWSLVLKTEVANNIMQLSSLLGAPSNPKPSSDESYTRYSLSTVEQLKTAQFWLSVASLAVIMDANWLELCEAWRLLKARQSQEPDTLCENHEDGKTLSHFHCEICKMDLCRECFAVLHLSRRNKGHKAHFIGSAANLCPRVDIHEGCTRLKLNNFLVLFNCTKLSGVVEIGVEAGVPQSQSFGRGECQPASSADAGARLCVASNGRCRFCANPLKSESQQVYGVCDYSECIKLSKTACGTVLACGHWCSGIRGEIQCLPCFHCRSSDIRQDADDLCAICFVDRLGEAPCVQLRCGHFFHYNCVRTIIEKRWNGPRIVFRFMQCPLCKQQIDHASFSDLLKPLMDLLEDVSKKAKLRLEYDGLLSNTALTSENSTFYNDPVSYAMERYMYVLCSKCNKAYFGGESRCQEELDSSTNFNPEELICGGCSDVAGSEVCGRHGAEYLEYKCRFCCTVAVYFCFGTTHFCHSCHADFQRLMTLPKHQLPKCPAAPKAQQLPDSEPCPLKIVQHPPTGEEFSLGCGICRNLRTF